MIFAAAVVLLELNFKSSVSVHEKILTMLPIVMLESSLTQVLSNQGGL